MVSLLKFWKRKEDSPVVEEPVQPVSTGEESVSIGSRNHIANTIAVISGKGGVGKSTVSGLLAAGLGMRGYRMGLLDADITGPSIPKMFGMRGGNLKRNPFGIVPAETPLGLKMMSLNLFLNDENDPAIWRGPRIAGAIKEFYDQVDWGTLDYLLLDMPPGTGDAAISMLQNIPLTGAIVVTTPQDLAFTIVRKAYHMLVKHEIPVIGVVENLCAGICPGCQQELVLFSGQTQVADWCQREQIAYLGGLPWDEKLAKIIDLGKVDSFYTEPIDRLVDCVIARTRLQA